MAIVLGSQAHVGNVELIDPVVVQVSIMKCHLRIARPVSDISLTQKLYCEGLGFCVVGSFENHEGFDGIMLGCEDSSYHFEFTICRHHPVVPQSTPEDLAVFYLPDPDEWRTRCDTMVAVGFRQVESFNPYWDIHGKTFEDNDGYRIVLQNGSWVNKQAPKK